MLSIIIPTHNEEEYLPLLLGAIKEQTFTDYEVIVADAGSKDQTVEIAKSFGCKIAPGGSPAKGRNEGAKIARGDLLLFMDADNIYLPPNFFENLISEFKKRNLGAATFPIYPQGKKIDKIVYTLYNLWTKLTQHFLPHATNSILVKKEIHQKVNGFDEEIKMAEDHYYARQTRKYGRFGYIKTKPVLTSDRRLKRDGRLKTYLKYILCGLHMIFLGPVKSDIFRYRFNHPHLNPPPPAPKAQEGEEGFEENKK